MFVTTVRNAFLQERLDAELFDPQKFALEEAVISSTIPSVPLLDLVAESSRITYGIVQPGEFVEPGRGVRLIRCVDIRGLSVDIQSVLWVSNSIAAPYTRSSVSPRDVLLGIAGSLGCVGLAPSSIEPANLNQSVAKIRIHNESGSDPEWLTIFLGSKYGQAILLRRSVGSVQQHLNLADLPSVPICWPTAPARKYVGEKIRQSGLLRSVGSAKLTEVTSTLRSLVERQVDPLEVLNRIRETKQWDQSVNAVEAKSTTEKGVHHRVTPELLSGRLDSWFYKPEFVRGAKTVAELQEIGVPSFSLSDIATVGYGFMPTEDYWSASKGAEFLRVTNIQDQLRVDVSKLEYVNPVLSDEQKYKLQPGDVICVQCGNSTGRIALITERYSGWVFPSFALRIRLNADDWDSGYVAAYLASELGQSQIQRTISITSVRPNTTKPAIESVQVPKFHPEVQRFIGNSLRSSLRMSELATPICDASKLLVEALVERVMTADEFACAQNQLEHGDQSGDREQCRAVVRC